MGHPWTRTRSFASTCRGWTATPEVLVSGSVASSRNGVPRSCDRPERWRTRCNGCLRSYGCNLPKATQRSTAGTGRSRRCLDRRARDHGDARSNARSWSNTDRVGEQLRSAGLPGGRHARVHHWSGSVLRRGRAALPKVAEYRSARPLDSGGQPMGTGRRSTSRRRDRVHRPRWATLAASSYWGSDQAISYAAGALRTCRSKLRDLACAEPERVSPGRGRRVLHRLE